MIEHLTIADIPTHQDGWVDLHTRACAMAEQHRSLRPHSVPSPSSSGTERSVGASHLAAAIAGGSLDPALDVNDLSLALLVDWFC